MPNKKIAILGFSLEGKAILEYLKKSAKYKNADIAILDRKFDKNYLKNLRQFDVIFRSPGIPYNLPEIQSAVKKDVKISSSTKLFFEEAEKIGCKIIGITGTKGKGTTSTLLYKILKAAKKPVFLAGNIGKPAIELLPKIKKNSVVLLELSSFQLQDLKQSPDIAIVLDTFEDHLDSHKNFKEYINAKSSIAKYQNLNDKIFYFPDNKYSKLIAFKGMGKKIPVFIEDFNLFKQEDLKIPGWHNYKNAAMAAMAAENLGIDKEIILKTIKNYRGIEHRLELARTIRINQRFYPHKSVFINFYNDSASTNPFTAIAAIKAFNGSKILICGGKDKNLDYAPLAKALKNSDTKLVILFGENKEKIKRQISGNKISVILAKDLKSAINITYKTAKKILKSLVVSQKSEVNILFSPASASFDMFKDYKDRGEQFKILIKGLK